MCYREEEKFRAQGYNDLIVYSIQALASLSAGVFLSLTSWKTMNLICLIFLIIIALSTIRADLKKDINEIQRIDSLKTRGLDQIEIYLEIINEKRQIADINSRLLMENYGNISYTFFPMGSSYLVSLNSGRINYIEDLELIIVLS